jgi:hypothetical protein
MRGIRRTQGAAVTKAPATAERIAAMLAVIPAVTREPLPSPNARSPGLSRSGTG